MQETLVWPLLQGEETESLRGWSVPPVAQPRECVSLGVRAGCPPRPEATPSPTKARSISLSQARRCPQPSGCHFHSTMLTSLNRCLPYLFSHSHKMTVPPHHRENRVGLWISLSCNQVYELGIAPLHGHLPAHNNVTFSKTEKKHNCNITDTFFPRGEWNHFIWGNVQTKP